MAARYRNRINTFAVAAALAAAATAPIGLGAQSISAQQTMLSLQRALDRLPRYGVFDYIAFSLDRGTVRLDGYAYSGTLKSDAEKVVRKVAGVDEVENRVELLPASMNDDRIRVNTFYRIYTDSVLSRYTSGGARGAAYEALEFVRFPGRQPFGVYPIHIVVKGGRTLLLGAVDSAADRQLAEFRAREVSGVFAIDNQLVVVRD